MLFGAHCSGGVKKALDRASEIGADAVQLFVQSPRAEAREVLLRVHGEPPHPGALREELDGVGADLDRVVERALDPAGAVSTEDHPATLAR